MLLLPVVLVLFTCSYIGCYCDYAGCRLDNFVVVVITCTIVVVYVGATVDMPLTVVLVFGVVGSIICSVVVVVVVVVVVHCVLPSSC